MSKKQRKQFKKQKGKDKILLPNKPNAAALRHLSMADPKSKGIKKGGFVPKKNILTDHSVRMKAKSHRLVVPTHKLK